jgi:arylformamidase
MNYNKVYDLTHPLFHNCPGWPDFDPPTVNRMLFKPRDICNVEQISFNTHTGTHIDVPYHFCVDGQTLDQVPLERFLGEGPVLDFSSKGTQEPITYDDLDARADKVKKGDIVMLYTGRGKDRGFNDRYLKEWPSIDESGAKWIVEKGVNMVGTDGLGIEMYGFPPDGSPRVHTALLSAGVLIAEEVYLEELAQSGKERFSYICLPLLLKDAGGCLARIIALDD